MKRQQLQQIIKEELSKMLAEGTRFDQRTGYQTANPEWLKWEDELEAIKEDLYNSSNDFDESLTKFVKLCKTIRQATTSSLIKMSSSTKQDWYNAMLNVETSIDIARNNIAWSSFTKNPIENKIPNSSVQNIISKLEVLETFLDEMPEKLSLLIKKTGITSEIVSQKAKEMENLFRNYQNLLGVQPTHWIKE